MASASWRLPPLSVDIRVVVDTRRMIQLREIRTPLEMTGDEWQSSSIVARLVGLDALSRAPDVERQHAACRASFVGRRRSVSLGIHHTSGL